MKFTNLKNNKSGFTLAELLIVIAIIAILVSLALPTFASLRQQKNAESCEVIARSLRDHAIQEYVYSEKVYASAKEAFEELYPDYSTNNCGNFSWQGDPNEGTVVFSK